MFLFAISRSYMFQSFRIALGFILFLGCHGRFTDTYTNTYGRESLPPAQVSAENGSRLLALDARTVATKPRRSIKDRYINFYIKYDINRMVLEYTSQVVCKNILRSVSIKENKKKVFVNNSYTLHLYFINRNVEI